MGDEDREEEADDDPERGPDQGRHDALVADHLARLLSSEAHRAQHPDLARALEHRQDERVHDSEQADDHGQREQDVQQTDNAVERFLEVRLEFLVRLDLRIREAGRRFVERRGVRVGDAALDVDERHLVLRVDVVLVEERVRDRHRAERRAALRQLEDAQDLQMKNLSGGCLCRERRADVEVVLLRVLVLDEGARASELGRHGDTAATRSRETRRRSSEACPPAEKPLTSSSEAMRGPSEACPTAKKAPSWSKEAVGGPSEACP